MVRGRTTGQRSVLAMVHLEARIPADHPLRSLKTLVDEMRIERSSLFDTMDAHSGRLSMPPERLRNADLLIHLFSIRSKRLFWAEIEHHLLSRWFLDVDVVEPGFAPTSFSKNRMRWLDHEGAELAA